jgi:hypothetical protein
MLPVGRGRRAPYVYFQTQDTERTTMKNVENILELTIETARDGNLYVPCAGVLLRGAKNFLRIARHRVNVAELLGDYPRGIPGTIVKIDVNAGRVWLVEPLRSDEYEPERLKLEEAGIKVPRTIEVACDSLPAWLHEMKRAVDAGYAKVVRGEFPEDLGEEPKRPGEVDEQSDKSEDKIDRLCNLVETLLGKLVSAK